MKRLPNMRIAVSRTNIQQVLDAGACVSYFGTKDPSKVYAEGKPDHLRSIIQRAGIIVLGDMEPVPTTKPPSDFIEV